MIKVAIIMAGLCKITAIAGFIFLAYHFEHWWIALFSLFFGFSMRASGE